jgi:hypothetical protein
VRLLPQLLAGADNVEVVRWLENASGRELRA